jgi:hypothetical protein
MNNKMKIRNRIGKVFFFMFSLVAWSGILACGLANPQGELVQQERTVSSFDAIEAGGAFRIFLTQGDKQSVVVEAAQNIIDDIETRVQGNTLVISTRKNLKDPGKMNIYITMKTVQELDISGACHLTSENRFKLDDLDVDCSGAAKIEFTLSAATLKMDISGASQVKLFGSASSLDIDVSGAAGLEAIELEAGSVTADISGAAKARINVTGDLSAEVSGAASLSYKGQPVLKSSDISGAGSLKKIKE